MSKEKIIGGDLDRAVNGMSGNRVFYSMAKTINLESLDPTMRFENIRVEFGQCRVVPDGVEFQEVMDEVKSTVVNEWQKMVDATEAAFKAE